MREEEMRKENVTGEERQEGPRGPCSGVYTDILDIYPMCI